MQSSFVSDPKTIKRVQLISVYFRSVFPGWTICCGEEKECSDPVFAGINVNARCSVEDVASSWRTTLSRFWKASDLQAGSHPSDLPLPIRGGFFTKACQALSAADWLYLLVEFSGCFSWVLICCLRDYPPSEFVFQTSSIDESHTTSFYYMCEGIWLRSPLLVSPHLFATELAFFCNAEKGSK